MRQLVTLAALGIGLLFVLSAVLWHAAPGDRRTTTEANVYYAFADPVALGAFPYRDVTIEYPPGALPVFLAPVWLLGDTSGARWDPVAANPAAERYEAALAVTLALLLAATIAVSAVSLRLLRATLAHATAALGVLAATPLLLGALPLTRYDAWPVLLTSLGLLAALAARDAATGVAFGAAASAKLYPLVVLPGLVARTWRDRGRRGTLALLVAVGVTVLVIMAPFLAAAPQGTVESVRLQLARGLQMESLGGSLLAAAWKASLSLEDRGLVPASLPVDSCSHCDGLVAAQLTGTLATTIGVVALLCVVLVLVLVARRAYHGTQARPAIVLATATSVTALVSVGKVLSAQFLLWLLPLVPLVAGRRGRRATALLVVAAAMTNLWFPTLYRDYVNLLAPGPVAFLLVRNGVLVALLVVLLWPERDAARLGPSDEAPRGEAPA